MNKRGRQVSIGALKSPHENEKTSGYFSSGSSSARKADRDSLRALGNFIKNSSAVKLEKSGSSTQETDRMTSKLYQSMTGFADVTPH